MAVNLSAKQHFLQAMEAIKRAAVKKVLPQESPLSWRDTPSELLPGSLRIRLDPAGAAISGKDGDIYEHYSAKMISQEPRN